MGVSFPVSIVPFIRRFAFGCELAHHSADRRSFDTHVQEKENVFCPKVPLEERARAGRLLAHRRCYRVPGTRRSI
jgi:hypothetical protein